jgi:hypothetical protein
MTAALERGEWPAACPGRTLSPGKTRYSFYRRLGGPQGRSGRAENLVPTGIRSPDRPARSQSLNRLSYATIPILIKVQTRNPMLALWFNRRSRYEDVGQRMFSPTHLRLIARWWWAVTFETIFQLHRKVVGLQSLECCGGKVVSCHFGNRKTGSSNARPAAD